MPSNQASLDSFFGSKSKGPKQSKLNSFFPKNKNTDKENNKVLDEEAEQKKAIKIKKDDDEEPQVKTSATKRPSPSNVARNKRQKKTPHPHAIVDDSDDEDSDDDAKALSMDIETTDNADSANKEKREAEPTKNDNKHSVKNDKTKKEAITTSVKSNNDKPSIQRKSSENSKKVETKVAEDESKDDKEESKPLLPTSTDAQYEVLAKQASKLVKELKLPTNEKLFEQITEAAAAVPLVSNNKPKSSDGDVSGQPMLYSMLVQTFEKIEKIKGRLEIQSLMTDLFRRVILTNPKELYPVVYLASNSVAPAYKCVELGIGDSILIKAIGEAYGAKPGTCPNDFVNDRKNDEYLCSD